ncbi:MAG: hypothetical protein K6U80_01255 [Firmicutes bacterium]|nr:hypothetical protein [Bacillota bacterium]
MKKILVSLFTVTIVISLAWGTAPAIYSAAGGTGQGNRNQIDFSEWGTSVQLPSSKWSAIGEFYNSQLKKTIFSYRREAIANKAGVDVRANISFIFERVNYLDINAYSPGLLGQVPIAIKSRFTAASGRISLKNAIGYLGVTIDQDGVEHTIVLVHALSAQKGMQVIMDIPSELYPQVKGEFNAALKSLRFK